MAIGSSEERLAKVMTRGWFPLGLYMIILCKHQLTAVVTRRNTPRIDPAYERVYSNSRIKWRGVAS